MLSGSTRSFNLLAIWRRTLDEVDRNPLDGRFGTRIDLKFNGIIFALSKCTLIMRTTKSLKNNFTFVLIFFLKKKEVEVNLFLEQLWYST